MSDTPKRFLPGSGPLLPSLLLGAAAAWAVASHWLVPGEPLSPGAWAGLLVGTLGLAAVLRAWILPGVVRRLSSAPGKTRLAWVLGCILLAVCLLRAGPLHSPRPQGYGTLTLTATGQRNPSAQGSELWLLEVRHADGTAVPRQEWRSEGEWEPREGILWLSSRQQPASLHWSGKVRGPVSLVMVSHPYSGILHYEWNGQGGDVDLYDPTGTQRIVELPDPTGAASRSTLHRVRSFVFHVTHVASLAMVLLALGLWLVGREDARSRPVPVDSGVREGLLYALPPLAVSLFWLLVVYPGMMSPDSTDQWKQALTGQYVDFHPVFHTVLLRLLTRIWESPAVIALAQLLAFSALVGWGCVTLRRAGHSRALAWVTSALFALAPVTGTHVVTLWKDVPFSLGMMALCILLFQAAVHREETSRRRFWVALVGTAAAVVLLRHNGLPAAVGAFPVALALNPRRWKVAAVGLVTMLTIAFSGRALLLRAFDIPAFENNVALVGYLGAHLQAGTPMSPAEHAVLESLHPTENNWNYVCYSNIPTVYDGRFDMKALARHKPEILPLFIELTRRDPGVTLKHLVCSSVLIWKLYHGTDQVNPPPIWRAASGEYQTIAANDLARELSLRHTPLLPERWSQQILGWVDRTFAPDLNWLFWGPALPLYLFLLAFVVACLRQRSWRLAAVVMPILLHTAGLAAFIPSQDVRYQFPVFLAALLFTPAWLMQPRREEAREAGASEEPVRAPPVRTAESF